MSHSLWQNHLLYGANVYILKLEKDELIDGELHQECSLEITWESRKWKLAIGFFEKFHLCFNVKFLQILTISAIKIYKKRCYYYKHHQYHFFYFEDHYLPFPHKIKVCVHFPSWYKIILRNKRIICCFWEGSFFNLSVFDKIRKISKEVRFFSPKAIGYAIIKLPILDI